MRVGRAASQGWLTDRPEGGGLTQSKGRHEVVGGAGRVGGRVHDIQQGRRPGTGG